MTNRLAARVAATGAATAAALALTAGTAGAHVTISEQDQVAGAYTVLTVSVPHGCEESPTTRIRIQMPEEIPTVTPSVNPNWDVEVVTEALAEPVDVGHGQTISERDAEVVYTAKTPLPHDLRDTMELSLKVPEAAAGETLYFPIIQECTEGESAWIEIPAAGEDPDELEKPAPAIVVSAPSDGAEHGGDGPGTTVASTTAETVTASATSSTEAAESGSNGLAIAALVVGGLGVALGGAALATRKR